MSAIGSATSGLSAASAVRTAVQISVPRNQTAAPAAPSDFMLEAAVQRVATLLYIRSRFEVPPDVIDMGGGLFNVVI
jgi:hypothetical protein